MKNKKSTTTSKLFILFIVIIAITIYAALASSCNSGSKGILQFYANGEDFVRQGFVSKDGWAITFDHVHITLSDIKSCQTDPPYNPKQGGKIKAVKCVSLAGTYTIDLAEGGENAEPLFVGEVKNAPVGHYNALHFKMVKNTNFKNSENSENSENSPSFGYSLVITGNAEKKEEEKSVKFTIKIENEYEYTCGEFVGDERKGILTKSGSADLEMTFHFDHIFGDSDTPMNDNLNINAAGFDVFASLAVDGVLNTNMADLKSKLSPGDYIKLKDILPTLGHVGEGHCYCHKEN